MFPLEHPVVPGQVIPLMLLSRYLALATHLGQTTEAEFGVVGIERGREVGGEDVRDVAVVARVLELGSFPDGRVSLVAGATGAGSGRGVAGGRSIPPSPTGPMSSSPASTSP